MKAWPISAYILILFKNLERELGEKIVSKQNYLTERQKESTPKLTSSIDEAMKNLFGGTTEIDVL